MHQIKNLKEKYHEKNPGGAVKGLNKKRHIVLDLKKLFNKKGWKFDNLILLPAHPTIHNEMFWLVWQLVDKLCGTSTSISVYPASPVSAYFFLSVAIVWN